MSEIINADYRIVPERTADVICAEIKTIEAHVYKTTLEGAIQIGKRLTELKGVVGHGGWLPWCKENLGYSERQAQKFIQISAEYGDENSAFSNPQICADLSISKAYSLLQLPEEEVERFVEEHDIKDMTVANLEAEIRDWKSKSDALAAELNKAEEQNQVLQKTVEESEQRHRDLMKDMDELKAMDPEEVEKLKEQLETEKKNLQKAKDDLAKEKEKTKDAIAKAVNAKADELQAAVEEKNRIEIQRLERQKELADKKVAELAKKLDASDSEDILKFKIKTDELQLNFRDIKEVIFNVREKDPEQADRMCAAVRGLLDKLGEGVK